MTKWPVQKPTQKATQIHVEHQDTTEIYFCVFRIRFSRELR